MNLQEIIGKQLQQCDPGRYEYLKTTGWLDEAGDDVLESYYADYMDNARNVVDEVSGIYGPPKYSSDGGDFFKDWYSAAIFAAGWVVEQKIVFVALEHHDRETPISVVIGAISNEQIAELRE